MCVRVFICYVVLCRLGRGLASDRSPVQGVLPTEKYIHKFQKVSSELEQAKRPNPLKDDDDYDDEFWKYDYYLGHYLSVSKGNLHSFCSRHERC